MRVQGHGAGLAWKPPQKYRWKPRVSMLFVAFLFGLLCSAVRFCLCQHSDPGPVNLKGKNLRAFDASSIYKKPAYFLSPAQKNQFRSVPSFFSTSNTDFVSRIMM